MEPVIYEIIFTGKALPDFDLSTVKNNLARLFRADDKKLTALFSGRSVTLKRTDDKAIAVKFLQTLQKAGAQVRARRAKTPAKSAIKTAPPSPNAPKTTAQQNLNNKPAFQAAAHAQQQKPQPAAVIASKQFDFQQLISAPNFELCALEKNTPASFLVAQANENDQPIHISAPNLPLAPVGSPLLEHPSSPPPPVQVDTSHLILGEMDNHPLAPTQPQPTPVHAPELEVSVANRGCFADQVPVQPYDGPVPDTDQLSMALPGSDIIEDEFKKLPVMVANDLGESLQLSNGA